MREGSDLERRGLARGWGTERGFRPKQPTAEQRVVARLPSHRRSSEVEGMGCLETSVEAAGLYKRDASQRASPRVRDLGWKRVACPRSHRALLPSAYISHTYLGRGFATVTHIP